VAAAEVDERSRRRAGKSRHDSAGRLVVDDARDDDRCPVRRVGRRRGERGTPSHESGRLIAEILPCIPDDVTVLAPTCTELLDALAQERVRITESMEQLAAAREILDRLINAGDS
jgi:hypothetical protein